jgi:polyhydroxyalkanoate synthesis regulator phasin
MNKLLGIASLALASAALAVALWSPRQDGAPAPVQQEAPAAASPADVEDLERRVRALEDTALGLSRRLMALEGRPVVSADGGVVAAPAALTAELEQLRAEVRGLVAGEALHSEGGRTWLKDMVRSVQEMRNEQRQARQQEWQQAQAQAQS